MNAISLFSGIGGIDIGFSAAGFNIIAQVEIDSYCRSVLKRHAPEWWENARQFTDVQEFNRGSIQGQIDIIFGGFPCQPHSVAGKRKGAMDSRNMWPEFRRIISEFRPRSILLENVPGILSTGYAPTIIAELTQMGYVGSCGIISAQNAGAPHKRERWFCVAYTKHNGHLTTSQQRGDDKAIQHITQRENPTRKFARKCSRRVIPKEVVEFATSPTEQECITTSKPRKKEFNRRRFVTEQPFRKAESRLGRTNHGIPDWLDNPQWPAHQGQNQYKYEASRTVQAKTPYDTNRIKALGNAVVPQIIYQIALEIEKYLSEDY